MSAISMLSTYDIKGLRNFLKAPEGRKEIWEFTCSLREKVEGPDKYLALCQKTEDEVQDFGAEDLRIIIDECEPFRKALPPGHDIGHGYQDIFHTITLMTADPFIAGAAYKSDKAAAYISSLHDTGCSVFDRYHDKDYRTGHAEIGAWMIFHLLLKLGYSENFAYLASYAIVAHTHYLKPMKVKRVEDFERQPYWYGINYEDNKPWGLAPLIARFGDRLDCNGASFLCRHITAMGDAVDTGGEEFSEKGFSEINEKTLSIMFLPQIRDDWRGQSTVLEHCRMMALSAFGGGAYSADDHLFKTFVRLMWEKVSQTYIIIKMVTGEGIDMSNFSRKEARQLLRYTLFNISLSDDFDRSWNILVKTWDSLDNITQAKWAAVMSYAQIAHQDFLKALPKLIPGHEEGYKSLAEEIMDKLRFDTISF